MNNRGVTINSEALKEEFKKRGLTASEVSVRLGYKSIGTISKALSNRRMTHIAVSALSREYNIPKELFVIEEKKPEPKLEKTENEKSTEVIGKDELYRIIYAAVYAAMKKALAE